jgi:hypothetical protein
MKKARSIAPGFSFVQPLPVTVIMVAAVVWSITVISVGTRAVGISGAAIVAIPRAVAIAVRMRRGDGARGDGAGGKTEVTPTAATVARTASVFLIMNLLLRISHRQRRRVAMVARKPVEPSSE